MDVAKLRKKWLQSLFTRVAVSYLLLLMLVVSTQGAQKLFAILGLIGLPLGAFFSYYFVYRKRGTKWLLWLLIILPISSIKEIMVTGPILVLFSQLPAFVTKLAVGGVALSLVTMVWFWINSFRLRREYLRLRALSKKPRA